MDVNESLNPARGWSSGRKIVGGAPQRGLTSSGVNADVLGWAPNVTGVAIRKRGDGVWFYRLLDGPGLGLECPIWRDCTYHEHVELANVASAIEWSATKRFTGFRITDI